jgi:CBS domain containing-hemolysin-like protein
MSVFRRNEDEPPPSDGKGRAGGRRRSPEGPRGQRSQRRAEHRGRSGGGADAQEQFIIDALHDLHDTVVREVMTPRVDVVALSIPLTAEAVTQAVRESGHSCFPVFGDNLDDLIGILYVNDLFRAGWKVGGLGDDIGATGDPGVGPEPATESGPGGLPAPTPIDISRRLRQPFLVPE